MSGLRILVVEHEDECPPALVLLVVVAPAVLVLGLGAKSLQLLGRGQPQARSWVVGTGAVVVVTGVLFSRTGPGLLLTVVGILLLLVALLPARDAHPGRSMIVHGA